MSLRLETSRPSTTGRRAQASLRAAAALLLPLALAGCGGASEGIGSDFSASKILSGTLTGPKEMDPAVYAATPICPEALVRDGTEFMPIFEPGKQNNFDAVRFQASVQRVARDCENAAGGGINIRVGVAGRVLSGRNAATGKVTVPVRIAVTAGEKVLYSKLIATTVDVQAPDYSGLFSVVDDGISLTIPESQAATIYVGLDGHGDVRGPAKPKKGKKPVTKD
ncbi:MAG: hypothetical protein GX458_21580 [Phyllobacteriaceae bacterium]|nr:hypothetical protein [Phyllobacteriaceae bacterium]